MELGLYCSLWLFIKEGVETARPLSEVDERQPIQATTAGVLIRC